MCALLDAPVYDGNYVESLHLLFELCVRESITARAPRRGRG